MTSDRVMERRQELYDYLQDHAHEPFSLDEIAYALGRSPGKAFSMDVSAVRHWANESNCCITNCYYDPVLERQVLVFLPEKAEAMLSAKPLRAQSRQTRTRLRNLGSQAEYTEKYGINRKDRAYARLNVSVAHSVEEILTAVDRFERETTHTQKG